MLGSRFGFLLISSIAKTMVCACWKLAISNLRKSRINVDRINSINLTVLKGNTNK